MPLNDDLVYFRPDLRMEPLINEFRAWTHLLATFTYALNLRHKLLPRASERAPELATRLRRDEAWAMSLADAFADLDRLVSTANGEAFEDLYLKVPTALRGAVELRYDRFNHASYFLFEHELRLRDKRFEARQTIRCLLSNGDSPVGGLGWPRSQEDRSVRLQMPFTDSALDELSRARLKASPAGQLAELLGTKPGDELFGSLVAANEPTRLYHSRRPTASESGL